MNQILMTEKPNNNRNKNIKRDRIDKVKKEKGNNYTSDSVDIDIKSITRFFAIAILIFGIMLSGSGAYALIHDIKVNNEKSIPVVTTERNGNSIKLTVKNEVGVKSIKYSWNDSTETVIQGKGKNEVEATINIIPGNNKLNISIVDSSNNTTQYVKNYVQEESDITEPEIIISNEDPNIKLTITDDTALDYVIYKYADNDEKKVFATDDNPTKVEIYIDNVLESQEMLFVEAVDKSQNYATKEQQVKGTTKPKITVVPDENDPSYLIIKTTDNDGLRMVVFYINEQEYKTDPNTSIGLKEFEYKIQVPQGTTNVRVNVYNISEQISTFDGVYNY